MTFCSALDACQWLRIVDGVLELVHKVTYELAGSKNTKSVVLKGRLCRLAFAVGCIHLDGIEMSRHHSFAFVTLNENMIVRSVLSLVWTLEKDASDWVPVISSLCQLMLDPHYRTTVGFQSVIEREWVVLGHRFGERYAIAGSKDTEQVRVVRL